MVVHHGCKVWPTSFSWKSWRSLTITAAKNKGDAAVIYPVFRALLTVLASWLEIADKISSQMSQILYRAFMPPGALATSEKHKMPFMSVFYLSDCLSLSLSLPPFLFYCKQ